MKQCDLLLIEDDAAIRSIIQQALSPLNLRMIEESDGIMGEARARDYQPSVILLDLGLPSKSGLEILQSIRAWFTGSVIVITAWQDEEQKLRAFELGAEDYVEKPFSPKELIARVKVALRRAGLKSRPRESVFNVGKLLINLEQHRVNCNGEPISLTQTEFRFLVKLAMQPGSLVSQNDLLVEIWGPNHDQDTHYLRILVSKLRKKLKESVSTVKITTEAGLGYRLEVDQ